MEQNNKAGWVVIFAMFIMAIYTIYALLKPVPDDNNIIVKNIIDSLQLNDKKRFQEVKLLKEQHSKDSVLVVMLKSHIDSLPAKINYIKTHYNAKAYSISAMPTDSQVIYLSNWLSKESINK